MELLKVTRDIVIRCILFGACKIPKVGDLFNAYSFSELVWAERIFSPTELKAFRVPLWVLSGYGSGYGYGDGSGYGYGSGSGYGYGSGSGYGYGYGSGYGYGYGYGDGYGSGYGYGDGSGSGYGGDIGAKILAI